MLWSILIGESTKILANHEIYKINLKAKIFARLTNGRHRGIKFDMDGYKILLRYRDSDTADSGSSKKSKDLVIKSKPLKYNIVQIEMAVTLILGNI